MKIICKNCGCHFPQEFEETLKVSCNLWGDHGMTNVPVEDKKKMWDWYFSMPSDELHVKYKLNILMSWMVAPSTPDVEFRHLVSNWDELTEQEQQAYEKNYFKKVFQGKVDNEKLEPAKRIN